MKNLLLLLFVFMGITTFAQTSTEPQTSWGGVSERKGQNYFYWGYNRASYLRSYIQFKGEGYDFELKEVSATDMPAKFDPNVYFNAKYFSVPQFNVRFGRFLTDQFSVSVGWDHMKYRLTPTQTCILNGYIDTTKYAGQEFTGTFNNQQILYTTSFMDFHHSNGFNFIRAAAEYRAPVWTDKTNKYGLYMWCSGNLGIFLPWTDFTFYGERHLNWLHFAGWGWSASSGLRMEMGKHFFAQVGAQFGRSYLGDIMLEDGDKNARAQQAITFMERSWSIGTYFGSGKKKSNKK
jgi:hypothetical protein